MATSKDALPWATKNLNALLTGPGDRGRVAVGAGEGGHGGSGGVVAGSGTWMANRGEGDWPGHGRPVERGREGI